MFISSTVWKSNDSHQLNLLLLIGKLYKKLKFVLKPKGPSSLGLSLFPKHEATRVFLLPPGWYTSLSQGYPSAVL